MISYQFTYLIGDIILLAIWFFLFFYRKDIKKEILIFSLIFSIVGLLSNIVYTTDWWHPLTITNTRIGIEDLIFGFSTAGIASVIYEEIFKKKIKIRKINRKKTTEQNKKLLFLGISMAFIFFASFYLLKINSFYSSVFAFVIPILFIWLKRKDLILNSLVSGLLLTLIAFLTFMMIEFITPGWVSSAWYLENLSGITILGVPLEDLIWFFFTGLFIGPLYEYWKEGKLINLRK